MCLILALVLQACDCSTVSPSAADAAPDARADATMDAGGDAAVDGIDGSMPDTGTDASPPDDAGVATCPPDAAFDGGVSSVGPAWSRTLGGAEWDRVLGVSSDLSGNLYVTGHFGGTVDFGGGPLTSAGSSDIFVASFSAMGDHRWSRRFGDGVAGAMFDSDEGWAVAVGPMGNVFVTGAFGGSVDFGGGTLSVSPFLSDVFVASFTPLGEHRWSLAAGGEEGRAIAVGPTGEVVVTGTSGSPIDFGGGRLALGSTFVAALTSNGAHLWSRQITSSGSAFSLGVAIDSGGNTYITGTFSGTVDFGGATLDSDVRGSGDAFVASFTPMGEHRWSRAFGGAGRAFGRDVAVDATGNVYATGGFDGDVSFGGSLLSAAGHLDVFLVSLSSAGEHRWSRRYGGAEASADPGDEGTAVAVDAAGNVIVSGDFREDTDFGGGVLTSAGQNDVFVLSMTSCGSHRWSRRYGGADYETVWSSTVDAADRPIVVGGFRGPVDFGAGPVVPDNGDAYVLVLSP